MSDNTMGTFKNDERFKELLSLKGVKYHNENKSSITFLVRGYNSEAFRFANSLKGLISSLPDTGDKFRFVYQVKREKELSDHTLEPVKSKGFL